MSEIMMPIPFDKLINWMQEEYKNEERIFGIGKDQFYEGNNGKTIKIFNEDVTNPLGPAAGPNTQLAQNIVSAYVSGARIFELKTVQIMDGEELRGFVPRPCINAQDEGYNCEWSTELTVQQAYEEYVKGWFAVQAMALELELAKKRDFVFNMSVGYDYDGITSKKIDTFINDMMDGGNTDIFRQCKNYLLENIDKFNNLTSQDVENISPLISSSITLSTLHGCPSDEIEKIAHYFLTEKNLHTYIKLNPTLLGYDFTRNILDEMGYDYITFDDRHFEQDLKFDEAVALVGRLKETANEKQLEFGVKITNTFPVQIKEGELPGEFMYMSGRSLYPLSVNVANQFSQYFDGDINISYSGGVDYFTMEELLSAGIKPLTFCTTILKPGGYARIKQMSFGAQRASLPDKIDVDGLKALAQNASKNKRLLNEAREEKNRKTKDELPLYDCYKAPCKDGGCPIHQQIPEYLELVSRGEYDKAFEVIAIDNVLPGILSALCNHECQTKCTRNDYETPLQIRNAKNIAVRNAQQKFIDNMKPIPLKTDKKAVVIGAGPAGVAAGTYLRRNGVDVTVFEKNDKPMGVVKHAIPEFRIDEKYIDLDYDMSVKTGVKYKFNAEGKYNIAKLRQEYDFVIIATGAWGKGYCPLEAGEDNMIDAMEFLVQSKAADCKINLGENIAVIGGGDVAMDCARAAKRATGAKNVDIVYRRTRKYMPAEAEEIRLALGDDVGLKELLSPLAYDGKTLKVQKMQLGEKGRDGRRKVQPAGEQINLQYDTVISATGARVDTESFEKNGIELDGHYPKLDENNLTNIENVYIAGDCAQGASTIVKAEADSKKIVKDILEKIGIRHDFIKTKSIISEQDIKRKKGILRDASPEKEDGERCLSCDRVCEICVSVCPNRANVAIDTEGIPQILHVDGMCNECGNCGTFCPYTGNPYKDKITLFWSREAFDTSTNKGMLYIDHETVLVRDENDEEFTCSVKEDRLSDNLKAMISAVKEKYHYLIM